MARRASSGVNPQALLIGAVVLILALCGGYWFLNRAPAAFDAPAYKPEEVDMQRSLSGNRNSVTGKLHDRQITESGQVVTIQMGTDANPEFLSILIPADFKGGNLNLQSEYTFLVEFNTKGLAVAIDVKQL